MASTAPVPTPTPTLPPPEALRPSLNPTPDLDAFLATAPGTFPQLPAVVAAIIEAFVPALPATEAAKLADAHLARIAANGGDAANAPSRDDVLAFFAMEPLTRLRAQDDAIKLLFSQVAPDSTKEVSLALWVLSTAVGTSALTGHLTSVPFHEMSLADRQQAIANLARSRLPQLVKMHSALKSVAILCAFGKSLYHSGMEDGETNPYLAALQFPHYPTEKPLPADDSHIRHPVFLNVTELAEKAGKGKDIHLDFDVVVVGSGAGGGIVAAELAQAGHRVLVAEKAQYTPPSKLSFGMLDSSARFYERSGALLTEDGSMQVYAGRAWGGGTYINWSASLRPPMKVREEWAKDYGLNYFVTKEYEEALDTVCNKAGVTLDGVKHNIPNSLLMEGCKKLGYHCDPVPQNTGGADHRCGFCTFGCPWGEKLGTHQTWLHDAADAGAQFLEGAYVSKVLIDAKRKSVRGVQILVGGGAHGNPPSEASAEHRITVTAHTVVASCGSINTPALLLRSGLRNRNIGRNLRLHPVSTVNGYFAGKLTKPYEGPILSTVSNVVADAAGGAKGGPPKGYGAKLEIAVSHPGFYTQFIPYRDPVDFRKVLLQYPRSVTVISLARDYDSIGRVWIDATGQARVDFTLGPKDAVSVTEGLIAGGKALAAAGATEVNTAQVYVPPLVLDAASDDGARASAIARWERAVRAESVRPLRTQLLCAHQMGSCRMAATPAKGAVKPDGETYEVKGLYVADASLLPTASGVNPMVTTFSMAYSVAQFMKKKLASRAAAGAQQARL